MLRSILATCCLLSVSVLPATAQSQIQEEGMTFLHAKVRVGNKLCMADHFHSGSSSGQPNQRAALSAAIAEWSGFTSWEYSARWGSFRLAESKRVNCGPSGNGWSCNIEARPCRSLR